MSNAFVSLNNEELFQLNGGFDGNRFFGGLGVATFGGEAIYVAASAVGAMTVVPAAVAVIATVTIIAGFAAIGIGL